MSNVAILTHFEDKKKMNKEFFLILSCFCYKFLVPKLPSTDSDVSV